ncbi:(R)-mandelonitrile lyase [Pectobacterium jejuense]|uniref:Cupin domain-containing protein n=1 Tax=Pectobacterium jejuense TaxID=2974022 RepID=A0ABW8GZH9_9GAMM
MNIKTSSIAGAFLFSAFAVPTALAADAQMTISESGSREFIRAPEANFTGRAWIDPLFIKAQSPQRTTGAYVSFEPGARAAWHTHPLGQTLVVISGTGWVQQWGGEKKVINAGDVVFCPPGVKHWHGATATTGMVHLAIQESDAEGKNVQWMEKVSDEQYGH